MGEEQGNGDSVTDVVSVLDEAKAVLYQEGHLDFAAFEKRIGHKLTYEQVVPIFQSMMTFARNINWWLGDALMWAEVRFPDKHSQMLDPRALSPDYYASITFVAEVYPPEDRLIATDDPKNPCPGLSWTHHREAASIENRTLRLNLLAEAMERGWSYRDMMTRAGAIDVGSTPSATATTVSETITITVGSASGAELDGIMAELLTTVKVRLVDAGLDVRSVSSKESGDIEATVAGKGPKDKKALALV